MKAKELAELLLEHPDFEVKIIFATPGTCTSEHHPWPNYHTVDVIGIGDVGYSSKQMFLEID